MPVIALSRRHLDRLLGHRTSDEEVTSIAARLGAEVQEFQGRDVLVEMPPNRSDMYSAEGFARAAKGILGIEKGLPSYKVERSGVILSVDRSVLGVRPWVVSGLAKGLALDEDGIRSLMDVQEKVHASIGRNRRKVSIGLHDFDRVEPPFTYMAVEPSSRRFVPLARSEEMDLNEILKRHEKGIDFAFLLEGFDHYPLIVDSRDKVLSFPPIINSTLTTVTEDTKNVFIDVTGTDLGLVSNALNLVATGMAEMGASIMSVDVRFPDRALVTPDLSSKRKTLDIAYANSLLGLELSPEEVRDSLERMRFGASVSGGKVDVDVPAYRSDILHPVDLVEDLAVGYGYENFRRSMPRVLTFGRMLPMHDVCDALRDVMTGLGFQEVESLALGRAQDEGCTRMRNPLSEEQTALRTSLIPSLMEVLKTNKRHDLPQRIFQIGDVFSGIASRTHLGGAVIHSRASFTEMKSFVERVAAGHDAETNPSDDPRFIPGRCAVIAKDGEALGIFGEVHPRLIECYGLGYQVAAFELDVLRLNQKLKEHPGKSEQDRTSG